MLPNYHNQDRDLQIEQKFILSAEREFITRDSQEKIVNLTWWGLKKFFSGNTIVKQ